MAQNGCVHKVQIYTGKDERSRTGTRVVQSSDKQIERKILHLYIMNRFFFFFFSCPALFESPRGDRIYCLCAVRRSRKGIPQAVKSITQK